MRITRFSLQIFLISVPTLICAGAAAYTPSSGSSSNGSSSSSGTATSSTGFKLGVGLIAASGTIGNQSGSIASRAINSGAVTAHLGFKSNYLEPFAYGEYEYSQQATAAALVSDSNMSGSGYAFGGGLAVHFGPLSLSAAYLPVGSFSLTQSTANGQKVNYSNLNGYQAALAYEFSPGLEASLSYRTAEFSASDQSGVSSNISSNKLIHNKTGAGVSWSF